MGGGEDEMHCFSVFPNKFNNTGALMQHSIYHIMIPKLYFILNFCTKRRDCAISKHDIMDIAYYCINSGATSICQPCFNGQKSIY